MGRPPAAAAAQPPQKRPRTAGDPAPPRRPPPHQITPQQKLSLSDTEHKVYEAIKSKKDMGMWTADLKTETGLPSNIVTKALKALQSKNLIKDVVNVRNKSRKMFMTVEFEPCKDVSGGSWYSEGSLDTEFITVLRQHCRQYVENAGVATIRMVSDSVRKSPVFQMECSTEQVAEILNAMVLDRDMVEAVSTGTGAFSDIRRGEKCYRCPAGGGGVGGGGPVGGLASIPCGVCPRIAECTPNGVISPKTCVYFDKWLPQLDF